MAIAILATGDELTHGDTLNTTSQQIASALSASGYSMGMHLVCGDKEQELLDGIQFLATRHDTVIVTGGLGPTSDDRTRFALANHFGVSLISYPMVLKHIESRLKKANLQVDGNQEVQALFPNGAELFENPHGTAWGCGYAQDGKQFVLLPGPPKECLPMFEHHAFPYLKRYLVPSAKICLKWQLFHAPEGVTAQKVETALSGIPCQIGYRLARSSHEPYLELKVRCTKDWVDEVQQAIEPLLKAHAHSSH